MAEIKGQELSPIDHFFQTEVCLNEQQARILSAAAKAFSNRGYVAATVSDIVALAHASKSTFYKHYPNKKAVLNHLFDLVSNAVVRRVEKILCDYPPTTAKRTYQAIREYIGMCQTYQELAKLLLIDTIGFVPELQEKREEMMLFFAGIFQRELMMLKTEQEKWIISNAMVGAIHQVVIQSLLTEEMPDVDHIATILEKMLSKILREESGKGV